MTGHSIPAEHKYDFRDGMVRALERDLVGPKDTDEDAEEVISELPLDSYVVGVLWPADEGAQEAPDPDSEDSAESEGDEDTPVSQALMRYPSSMGVTFTVDLNQITEIQVELHAAQYIPSEAKAEGRLWPVLQTPTAAETCRVAAGAYDH